MSRGGILLAIDRVLAWGLSIELEVDWPVRLADENPVKLVIKGKIVWSKKNGVALAGVTIGWYGFHPVLPSSDLLHHNQVVHFESF